MANDCLPQVQACAMRVTRIDASGVPTPGASSMYTTDAFTQIQLTPQYEDGDEVTQKNACGAVCINYKSPPSFKRIDIQITLCTPDPQLMELLLAGTVLTSGARVGFAAPAIGVISAAAQNGVGIEVWAKRIRNGSLDATNPYAWWTFPKMTNAKLGQMTQENGPNLPVISGELYENPNWFNGPLNNWPVASDKVAQWIPWNALPTVACGYQTVAAT